MSGPLPCGCCEGVHVGTPESVANRPSLPALRYRVGTHASFLSTMLARLSAKEFEGLVGLTTRDRRDPAIALLDAWASIADVLAFYQERIANEGFLRTAVERRSVLELARLVGYEARPGLAAATHVAFELEQGHDEVVPDGVRVQSMPGPGELPQVYETSEPLAARAAFNRLRVRLTKPQTITKGTAPGLARLWLKGTGSRLQPNDGLLIVVGEGADATPFLRLVDRIEEDFDAQRTLVRLQVASKRKARRPWAKHVDLNEVLDLVTTGASSPAHIDAVLPGGLHQDSVLRLAQVLRPELKAMVYRAWSNAVVSKPERVRVYAMRVRAPLFGHNNIDVAKYNADGQIEAPPDWISWEPDAEHEDEVYLDNAYPGVRSGGIIAMSSPEAGPLFFGHDPAAPITVDTVSRKAYGLSGKSTRVQVKGDWIGPFSPHHEFTMEALRRIVVFADNELLELGEEPIESDVCRTNLELAELYEGLTPGRTLVVSGERADLPGLTGVTDAELVVVADVRQGPIGENGAVRPGDRNHTFLVLGEGGLRHCYVRKTVKVYGNVVHATHGETKSEVLGSGDARKAHQAFALRSAPVTRVSAATPTGLETELEVRVDDIRWPAWPWFLGRGPAEPGYVARTDEAGVTTVLMPNGVEGRRLPTGVENVRARFRVGLGTPGNTDAGRISLLIDKPLAVRGVVNPVPATGGADAEPTDDARANAPLPLRALDRLVSVVDYAHFAQTFAGVGKAAADRLSDSGRQVVVVTVAGAGGIALTPASDVVANLRRALRRYGDPSVAVRVLVAERLVLELTADVRVHPDHEWAVVEPKIRTALLDRYSFERQGLGDDVAESDVLATVHRVAGVGSVRLARIASAPAGGDLPVGFHPARRVVARGARREGAGLRPAEHLYLASELPEFLVLREATA